MGFKGIVPLVYYALILPNPYPDQENATLVFWVHSLLVPFSVIPHEIKNYTFYLFDSNEPCVD